RQILPILVLCIFFFFSSRRRHTRFSRDWSSDVCSSDLIYRILPKADVNTRVMNNQPYKQIHQINNQKNEISYIYNILNLKERKRSEERRVGKECRYGKSPDH